MKRRRRFVRWSLIVGGMCLAGMVSMASAQDDEAVAAYQRGADAFSNGQFQNAKAEFTNSFNRRKHPLTAYFLSYTYLDLYDFKNANDWANVALRPMPPYTLDKASLDGAQQIADFTKEKLSRPASGSTTTSGGITMSTSAITSLPKPSVPGKLALAPNIGMIAAFRAPTIVIETATYGGNCGVPRGNKTDHISNVCNGKAECKYTVDYTVIGDPAPGCVKDYEVVYECSGSKTMQTVKVTGEEAGFRKTVFLRCAPPVAGPTARPAPGPLAGEWTGTLKHTMAERNDELELTFKVRQLADQTYVGTILSPGIPNGSSEMLDLSVDGNRFHFRDADGRHYKGSFDGNLITGENSWGPDRAPFATFSLTKK